MIIETKNKSTIFECSLFQIKKTHKNKIILNLHKYYNILVLLFIKCQKVNRMYRVLYYFLYEN